MKYSLSSLLLICAGIAIAQPSTYTDDSGNINLAGPITIEDLQQEPFVEWFTAGYGDLQIGDEKRKWVKNLKDTQIDIYLGTWCGDSKRWVPRFIKLWDDLGLDRDQLKLTTLYNGKEQYKQGPNREEKGLKIHRVPTFIFKKNGEEYARIVEYPSSDLETDIAQIALGYPSDPNYKAAAYLLDLLSEVEEEEIYENWRHHLYEVYDRVGRSSELNTLGYVFLRSDRIEEALVTFKFNTALYPYDPNVYDSFGEGLELAGNFEEAIDNYEKALALNPDNSDLKSHLESLKKEYSQDSD